MIAVQELPGSELLCYHSSVLGLGLPGFALVLTALEPPGSWLLELDLSVLGLDSPGFELLLGNFAVLLVARFGQESLRLPQG